MKIVLLGYMGSGKTTIGKRLAKKLFTSFYDLDHYIESKENALKDFESQLSQTQDLLDVTREKV